MSMEDALNNEARAREGIKQFAICLKKFEMLEGAFRFYYFDHYKNLPQTDKTTFHYFRLIETFLRFRYCTCKTEANIHTYMTALTEDM